MVSYKYLKTFRYAVDVDFVFCYSCPIYNGSEIKAPELNPTWYILFEYIDITCSSYYSPDAVAVCIASIPLININIYIS